MDSTNQHQCVISIGSNTADAVCRVMEALYSLSSLSETSAVVSSNYYTTPSYNGNGNDYTNMVVSLSVDMDYETFGGYTKELEIEAGRTPEMKGSGVVPLDVDIVVWDGDIIRTDDFSRIHFTIGYKAICS